MIFKTEINPRDHKGYYEMICHLQTECLRRHGVGFDTTKIAMGQLTHNSEMCWFEGYVNDQDIVHSEKQREFDRMFLGSKEFLEANGYTIFKADGKDNRVVNIHIASLGEFRITQNTEEHLNQLKNKMTKILMGAIAAIDCKNGR